MNEVSLTDSAIKSVEQLLATRPEFTGKQLRLYIEGKGCDGFYYGVTFDDASHDDLRFNQVCKFSGRKVIDLIVDKDTIRFVEGSVITWNDDEKGQGFLVENPNHRAFRGKFFKRESWKNTFLNQSKENPQN